MLAFELLAKYRDRYEGQVIELVKVQENTSNLTAGQKGTVQFITDHGEVAVLWENGLEANIDLVEGDRIKIA